MSSISVITKPVRNVLATVEQALLEQLQGLGYTCTSDDSIGPDGKHPERESYNGWSKNTLYLQEGTYE